MGWQNKIENNKFSITTGDGNTYFPLWKMGETSKDFNVSFFDFIEVEKSLIERKKPKSGKYPLIIWFQGDDNFEQSEEFYRSADDSRAWTVNFPNYGTIKGQPISIGRNDENFNITQFTIDFWESLEANYPKSNFSVKDNTLFRKQAVMDACANSYASNDVFKTEDINKNKDSNILVVSSFDNLQSNDTYSDYQNAFAQAQKATENLIDNPLTAIQKTQALLDLPNTYNNPVLDRVNAYLRAFNKLKVFLDSVADKLFFESQGATCISALCNASVNPLDSDYEVITDIEFVASAILYAYQQYLDSLDFAYVSVYDVDNTYVPDVTVQTELYNMVMYTIANLYELGFEAKQERIVYVEKDTNIILLTHKYLGMDATDENLKQFRTINNIKLNELFKIKKSRKIKYYV